MDTYTCMAALLIFHPFCCIGERIGAGADGTFSFGEDEGGNVPPGSTMERGV